LEKPTGTTREKNALGGGVGTFLSEGSTSPRRQGVLKKGKMGKDLEHKKTGFFTGIPEGGKKGKKSILSTA